MSYQQPPYPPPSAPPPGGGAPQGPSSIQSCHPGGGHGTRRLCTLTVESRSTTAYTIARRDDQVLGRGKADDSRILERPFPASFVSSGAISQSYALLQHRPSRADPAIRRNRRLACRWDAPDHPGAGRTETAADDRERRAGDCGGDLVLGAPTPGTATGRVRR